MTDPADIRISPAKASDLPALHALLTANGMPLDGVDEFWRTFVVARDGERIVGCAGSQAYPFAALLRSVAVDPAYRGRGIGRRLVRELLDRLASRGLREFYLLTTDAEEYFRRRGFKTVDRDEVHPQILGTSQFQGGCPDTAVCMRLVMMA